jgi:hypothetical protein
MFIQTLGLWNRKSKYFLLYCLFPPIKKLLKTVTFFFVESYHIRGSSFVSTFKIIFKQKIGHLHDKKSVPHCASQFQKR